MATEITQNPLYKENIVKPDEYLRAAALNDLYTLRKFYDYEVRYGWGSTPKDVTPSSDHNLTKAEAKEQKKADKLAKKEAKKTGHTPKGHSSVKGDHLPKDAEAHRSQPQHYKTVLGENALHLAAAYGNFKAMQYIFSQGGMDVNTCDAEGFNTVHHAVLGGNLDCFKWTVKKGGDWKLKAHNTARGRGETPFMLAVRCHRKSIVDYMLKKFHFDFDEVNADHKTVHGIALETGRPGMTWLMRKKTGEPKSQLEIDYCRKLKADRALKKSNSHSSKSSSSIKSPRGIQFSKSKSKSSSRSADHHRKTSSSSSSSSHSSHSSRSS